MTVEINFSQIAAEFGTPTYIYDTRVFKRQFTDLDRCLKDVRHLICYAVKANSNISVLRFFDGLGSGFDIVSEGELRRVLKAGGDPSKTVFAGVAKTKNEISFALSQNIRMLNVESASELRAIEEVARSMRRKAPVSFRVNPNISVETHPYLATGLRSSKFGVPLEDVSGLFEKVQSSEWLEMVGVDCHIGSQISEIEPLRAAYSEVLRIGTELKSKGAAIRYLDFGGGLGVSYSGHYEPLNLAAYGLMIADLVRGTDFEIMVEPGKFLVVEGGSLLTRVLYRKQNGDNTFLIVDAGMNDLIRPSLYEAFHQIDLLRGDSQLISGSDEVVHIVGPVCETGCYLARSREMPKTEEGDLLVVRDAGAYGATMASNYNSRALPAEVLLREDGSFELIRRRQELDQLWRDELA